MTRSEERQESRLKVITLVFDDEGRFQGVRDRNGKLKKIKLHANPVDLGGTVVTDPVPVPIPIPQPPLPNSAGAGCGGPLEIWVGDTKVAHLDLRE